MSWRALAIFSGMLAAGLALWILGTSGGRERRSHDAVAQIVPQLLLVVAPASAGHEAPVAVMPAELPVASTQPGTASPASCVRLGKFPTRAWAQEVAEVLAAAPGGESAAEAMAFRLRGGDQAGYFIVFPVWTLSGLSQRLTEKAPALKRWVSASAVPEPCQPAER